MVSVDHSINGALESKTHTRDSIEVVNLSDVKAFLEERAKNLEKHIVELQWRGTSTHATAFPILTKVQAALAVSE